MISSFAFIAIVFSFIFGSFNLDLNALTIKQNDQLVEKIAKDISIKFCNGVGFGLSQESAINFAMMENKAIFKKKKGIENIDKKIIAEKVFISIVDKCAYPLDISEEQWQFDFENG